jgi:polyisoprenoid-binding protein YceI
MRPRFACGYSQASRSEKCVVTLSVIPARRPLPVAAKNFLERGPRQRSPSFLSGITGWLPAMRTWTKWLIGGLVVALIAVVALPWAYINFIQDDAPPPLEISDAPTTTTAAGGTSSDTTGGGATAELAGTWNVVSESTAGYRVDEVLFGQDNTVAGRTNDVTGSITLTETSVTEGEFTVDMATVETDDDRRDGQFRGNIMSTDEFPTATFKLTEPIDFGTAPADGQKVTASATGDLTLRGVTNSVTFDVEARKTGNVIEVSGSIPIVFSDYDIPSANRAAITVKDNGEMEFLLTFNPA